MSEKKDVTFEIYSDSEKMLEQIVEKYDLPDQSKALRCLLDYVEEKLQEGHDLSRMMKHLFGLSRGDKFAKSFRIKILEVIKKESLGQHRKELEDLLIY